METSGVMK